MNDLIIKKKKKAHQFVLLVVCWFLLLNRIFFLQEMTVAYEAVFMLYSFVGAVIFIVMSCYGGVALRSSRSQVLTRTPCQSSGWGHKEVKATLFLFSARFRQSSWWLQQESNPQLSRRDGRKVQKIRWWGRKRWSVWSEKLCRRCVVKKKMTD